MFTESYTLYLRAEELVGTVDCCFTGAVITQWGPLPLFLLTFGSSLLGAERRAFSTQNSRELHLLASHGF